MDVRDKDAFERPWTALEGIPNLDASLVIDEMSRLLKQVVFVNHACRRDICLFNFSFSWLQARALYNQTSTWFQVEVTHHAPEKAHLVEHVT